MRVLSRIAVQRRQWQDPIAELHLLRHSQELDILIGPVCWRLLISYDQYLHKALGFVMLPSPFKFAPPEAAKCAQALSEDMVQRCKDCGLISAVATSCSELWFLPQDALRTQDCRNRQCLAARICGGIF